VVDNFFLLSAVFLALTTNGDIGKLLLLLSFITPTGRKTVTYDKNIHSKIQHTQTISYKSENKSSTHKQLKLTPTFHADSSGAARKDTSARLRGWVPPCHVPIKFSQVSKPMYTLLLCIFSFDYIFWLIFAIAVSRHPVSAPGELGLHWETYGPRPPSVSCSAAPRQQNPARLDRFLYSSVCLSLVGRKYPAGDRSGKTQSSLRSL